VIVKRGAFLAVLVLVGFALPGEAGEQTSYCWLAFGPDGKLRVLARLEGNSITLQRHVGKEVVGKAEQFASLKECKGVTVQDPGAKTSYVIQAVEDLNLVPQLGRGVEVVVEIKGPVGYRQAARVQMARRLEKAPVIRFHAPLVSGLAEDMRNAKGTLVWKPPAGLHLIRGDKPTDLYLTVRNKTPERGSYVVVVVTDETGKKCLFPDGVRPVVDVEFLPGKPGARPVKKRYALDRFC
jgi:hypothetical protein